MKLDNNKKIRVIENYNNIKNHIETKKELVNILSNHLKINEKLITFEINCYNSNNQNLILNSKMNKL